MLLEAAGRGQHFQARGESLDLPPWCTVPKYPLEVEGHVIKWTQSAHAHAH